MKKLLQIAILLGGFFITGHCFAAGGYAGSFQGSGYASQPSGSDCCPVDQPTGECWCRFVHYQPCPYKTWQCVNEPVYYCKTNCRKVPQYYQVQKCRYVPSYYCETKCRYVPEYYQTQHCTYRKKYLCEEKCRYIPRYYIKKVCANPCPAVCPQPCPTCPEPACPQACPACPKACPVCPQPCPVCPGARGNDSCPRPFNKSNQLDY